MTKVVVNKCFGGFGLSEKALDWLWNNAKNPELAGGGYVSLNERHDPDLVRCVEKLGEEASDEASHIQIEEIEGNRYRILECDGYEWIETPDSISWVEV